MGFQMDKKKLEKGFNLREMLNLYYCSDSLQFSLRGNVSYNSVKKTLPRQQNQMFFNY